MLWSTMHVYTCMASGIYAHMHSIGITINQVGSGICNKFNALIIICPGLQKQDMWAQTTSYYYTTGNISVME